MSWDPVNTLCEQLVKAVTAMMDPASTQRYRLEALKFCEEFKEKSPVCVSCGLKLAEKSQTAIVRHFGLQILEHVVKFRWNTMSRFEKVFLKNSVMALISNGTQNILEEESHIKDVLSRIVVEMIKREWPQHWPDMLKELDTLSEEGETQTELVMFILLRLAEDVVTFQTLPAQRRRDIQQTLSQNMEKIFSFLLNTLQQSVNKYRCAKIDAAQESKAQANCRVGIAALNTLAGYIDWVAMNHITADNCKLLEMLCLLLNEPELQIGAAECLLIAVSRKGKLEDRKPLMVLFGDVAMHYILSAAQTADGEGLVEKQYVFLKRLCQVLCSLGSQLCTLVGPDSDVEIPVNLGKFLESFLAFTTHPSQFLRSSTQIMWGVLFRHEVLSRDPVLLAIIPNYLRACMTNLVKLGFPSKTECPSCEYSRFDFDSDEDFNSFFNSFRAQQGDVIRMACRLDPHTGFQLAGEWLKYQLSLPLDTGTANSKRDKRSYSIFSPSFVHWDAMTFFLESIVSPMFRTLDKEKIPVSQGIELLQRVLAFETKDPLILSCILSNVSALFPFVTYRPEYLPEVIVKLFASVTFEVEEESKAPRTRAVKNVRRHACSSIIKMCRDYPQLVLPNFDMLYNHVKQLLSNELLLTQMEKCALMEALVLISNQFKDYQRQKAFLEELMTPVATLWLSDEMKRVLMNPEDFIRYVGADNRIVDPIMEDPCGLNRSREQTVLSLQTWSPEPSPHPTSPEHREQARGDDPFACMASATPQPGHSGAPDPEETQAATTRSSESLLTDLPEGIQSLISQAISKGIAAGLRQQHSASIVSESLSDQSQISPSASLTPPQGSASHSRAEDDLFLGEKILREPDLSVDEGIPPNTFASLRLFPPGLFKSLLHKAKATAHLTEDETPIDPETANRSHDQGLFSEPVAEQQFIPTPKLFMDVVQKQWTSPASNSNPSRNESRFYAMAPNFTQRLQLPSVDSPVAALASSSPFMTGDVMEGLKAEDKKFELTFRKHHKTAAWAIRAASAASFFNRTSLIWLQEMQSRLPPQETCLKENLNKIIAATQFSADATINAVKYASQALASAVISRRLLWLRPWHKDLKTKWQLATSPYAGDMLFGEPLNPLLIEKTAKRRSLPFFSRRADTKSKRFYRKQFFLDSQRRAYNQGQS